MSSPDPSFVQPTDVSKIHQKKKFLCRIAFASSDSLLQPTYKSYNLLLLYSLKKKVNSIPPTYYLYLPHNKGYLVLYLFILLIIY